MTPQSDQLALAYGDVALGGVAVGAREIDEADLARIKTIPNHKNIAIVAPKLLGAVTVQGVPGAAAAGASRARRPDGSRPS